MKRQKTAKVFKIIYFIISALWMAWWGGAVLFAIAGPMEDKIIAFFAALLPIPIYYILKGFIAGSKKIMEKSKYILIIVVLGIIIFVGWSFVGDYLIKSKKLTVECFPAGEEYFIILNVSNGKMCFIDPDGRDPQMCVEISKFNSDVVKSTVLHPSSSGLANTIMEGAPEQLANEEIYVKLDRTSGMFEFFYVKNDEKLFPGRFLNCRKRQKL